MCPFRFDDLCVYIWVSTFEKITFCSSFFFLFQPHYLIKSTMNSAWVHCSWISQILLFSHFFIKNGSYNTIYIFKNYFTIVFSVLAKITSFQTDFMFWTFVELAIRMKYSSTRVWWNTIPKLCAKYIYT